MREYRGKEVKIDLDNNIYYRGLVLSVDDDYIKLRDINDNLVYINIKNIISIREVSK